MSSDLPVDGDGVCMRCKAPPPEAETILCLTCATPWHVPCLLSPPETLASVASWLCPDCTAPTMAGIGTGGQITAGSGDLVTKIRAIEADGSLDEKEKARRRQALVSGRAYDKEEEEQDKKRKKGVLDCFKCSICMQLPERPVTTPCGHNFCLKCFKKWIGQGKYHCVNCRSPIPSKIALQPRINSALVAAIRTAKSAKPSTAEPARVYYHTLNDSKPDKAFTTERAKRNGKANACSGKIFVTVPPDHFGPILAENDPVRNMGVLVGDTWEDRLDCRQWGAHLPHVAGIAGQSGYGAQSVALSGGYEDDEDHGEWFLYTGSGGRDLSGNKRTNKEQSFDQKFESSNEALRVSCIKGYPVRVVRSFKEKRSSYAPEKGVRYDGVYRIEKCWRKPGIQGFRVCRYLFVRCDNAPAPWTSDEHGDRPRPLPVIKELADATDITERKESPSWDYDEEKGWIWKMPPPKSKKPLRILNQSEQEEARKAIRRAQKNSVKERLLKEFSCAICHQVMTSPLSTPCGHNFCEPCLLGYYADKSFVRERGSAGGRTLRARKIVKKCPSCPTDICDYLVNPQVNREFMGLIESLQREADKQGEDEESKEEGAGSDENKVKEGSDLEVKETEATPEKLVDVVLTGSGEASAHSAPQKRIKLTVEVKKDAISDDGVESPSSPLAVTAHDDELE